MYYLGQGFDHYYRDEYCFADQGSTGRVALQLQVSNTVVHAGNRDMMTGRFLGTIGPIMTWIWAKTLFVACLCWSPFLTDESW